MLLSCRKHSLWTILFFILFLSILYQHQALSLELGPVEIGENKYYSILTFDGDLLATTRYQPLIGDEYLTADNRLYVIEEVKGFQAKASLKEVMDFSHGEVLAPSIAQEEKGRIGIFHTHNAESYIPTDGTHSIDGKGGIHAVGRTFADSLEELGVKAIFSEELHLPHDRGAYRRSRETVIEILGEEPDAIFDLHRNAAPYDVYHLEIDGEELTHLQFVVGLLNPHAEINRAFSYDLKETTNALFPSLVKGVFLTQGGTYNQDLYPTMLLVEVGAQTNPRDAAERSMELFAQGVYHYFYGWSGVEEDPERRAPLIGSIVRSILYIIGLTIGGSLFFIAIHARDVEDFKERIRILLMKGMKGIKKIPIYLGKKK